MQQGFDGLYEPENESELESGHGKELKMNQQVTIRLPSALAYQISKARGSEPVAKFILRAVTDRLNENQENEKVIRAVESATLEILKTINSLVAE